MSDTAQPSSPDPRLGPGSDGSQGDGRARRAVLSLVLAMTGIACALVSLTHGSPAGSLDDVFVVLVEARTWLGAMGQGLTSSPDALGNTGGGATSLLDVGVKALGLWVAPDSDPIRLAGWVGIALIVAAGWTISYVALGWTGSRLAAGVTALGALLSPGLLESAGYLLEGPLFGVLWLLALVAMVSGGWVQLALALLGLSLGRPEGALLAPLVGLCALAGSKERGAFAVSPGGGLLGLVTAGAAFLARYLTSGYWLPTTFFAKASDSRWHEAKDGLHYVGSVLGTAPGLLVLGGAATALLLFAVAHGEARRRGARLLLLAAAYACAVVVSGGDSYEGARLFMPVGLAVWLALAAIWPRQQRLSLALAGLSAASALGAGAAGLTESPLGAARSTVPILRAGPIGLDAFNGEPEVFEAIAAALGATEVFAHRHTQRVRWFAPGLRVLDLTGLTDRAVARRPAPGPVRFGRDAVDLALGQRVGALHLDPLGFRPRSIVDVDPVRALSDPSVAGEFGGRPFLSAQLAAEVARDYVGASRAAQGAGGVFNLFIRRDLAERFRVAGFRVAPGAR